MELSETGAAGTWAPNACTLPAAERPLRAAEFDGLFAEAVRGIERAGPTCLRLDLQAGPRIAGRAAELASPALRISAQFQARSAAETECCSFFIFNITIGAGRLVLDITVPAARAGLLDALASHAAAVAGPAA